MRTQQQEDRMHLAIRAMLRASRTGDKQLYAVARRAYDRLEDELHGRTTR